MDKACEKTKNLDRQELLSDAEACKGRRVRWEEKLLAIKKKQTQTVAAYLLPVGKERTCKLQPNCFEEISSQSESNS